MDTGLRIDEPVRRRPGAAARSLDCGHRRCKPNVLCADAMQMRCELLGVFPEVPVWIDVWDAGRALLRTACRDEQLAA